MIKKKLFLTVLETEKSKIKEPVKQVSFLPSQVVTIAACAHMSSSFCLEREREFILTSLPVLIKALIPPWGPTLMISSKPNNLPKACPPTPALPPNTIMLWVGLINKRTESVTLNIHLYKD